MANWFPTKRRTTDRADLSAKKDHDLLDSQPDFSLSKPTDMKPPNSPADSTRAARPCPLPGARRPPAVGWCSALLAFVARIRLLVQRGPLKHEPRELPAGAVLAALALAIPLALGLSAKADVLFQNTSNDLLTRFSGGGLEFGNQIVLNNGGYITNFSFEYYGGGTIEP
jgi:hypothetical protein